MNAEDDGPSTRRHARLKAAARLSGISVMEFHLRSAQRSSKKRLNRLMNPVAMLKRRQGWDVIVPICNTGDNAINIYSEGVSASLRRLCPGSRGKKQREALRSGPGAEEAARGFVRE